MSAIAALALPIKDQGVIADLESQSARHGGLPILDAGIDELFDAAALYAHDVIVMGALIDLEDRHAVLEMVSAHEARRLELGQHPIHGRKTDVLVGIEELAIDVLGRQMARGAALEQLENLEAWHRDFQARLAKILAFHQTLSSMMRPIIAQAIHMRLGFKTSAAAVLLAMTLSGCVYRMNIQQGNYLEGKTIDQVQVGMTRSQVRYLLGTPMVPDAFDDSRWDYVYYLKKGRLRAPEQRHMVVRFVEDKVSQIDRASMPSNAKIPLPDVEPRSITPRDIPPSDPAAVQPENPGSTQPGAPQPQTTPPPKPAEEPQPNPGK